MNAKKNTARVTPTTQADIKNPHLRVLSSMQRKLVGNIAEDWQDFTKDVFTKMFNKI